MFTRIAVLALSMVMASAMDIPADSEAGRTLVQNARKVADNYGQNYQGNYNDVNWDDIDTSYIAGYSAKFQGCHHVQKWNDQAADEDDIKIMTQRLVRFRMCPADTCTSASTKGCDSNYGDYLVDMETYVEAYMSQMQAQYMNNANRELAGYNMNFDDLITCSELSMNDEERKRARELRQLNYYNQNGYYNQDEDEAKYYVGPYCAEQGGEIRLGVFSDDTCTVAAEDGEEVFKMVHNGMSLPYSESSIVNIGCMSCGGYGEVNEMCSSLYQVAGKCETKMSVYYPNESACSYIEGIKVIRDDGVIRTTATRKSTAAAVTTGIFLTAAVLLSGYVYYLRTKLGRARINLAASSQNASL